MSRNRLSAIPLNADSSRCTERNAIFFYENSDKTSYRQTERLPSCISDRTPKTVHGGTDFSAFVKAIITSFVGISPVCELLPNPTVDFFTAR